MVITGKVRTGVAILSSAALVLSSSTFAVPPVTASSSLDNESLASFAQNKLVVQGTGITGTAKPSPLHGEALLSNILRELGSPIQTSGAVTVSRAEAINTRANLYDTLARELPKADSILASLVAEPSSIEQLKPLIFGSLDNATFALDQLGMSQAALSSEFSKAFERLKQSWSISQCAEILYALDQTVESLGMPRPTESLLPSQRAKAALSAIEKIENNPDYEAVLWPVVAYSLGLSPLERHELRLRMIKGERAVFKAGDLLQFRAGLESALQDLTARDNQTVARWLGRSIVEFSFLSDRLPVPADMHPLDRSVIELADQRMRSRNHAFQLLLNFLIDYDSNLASVFEPDLSHQLVAQQRLEEFFRLCAPHRTTDSSLASVTFQPEPHVLVSIFLERYPEGPAAANSIEERIRLLSDAKREVDEHSSDEVSLPLWTCVLRAAPELLRMFSLAGSLPRRSTTLQLIDERLNAIQQVVPTAGK